MKPVSRLQRALLATSIAITGTISTSSFSMAQDGPEFEPDYYHSILTGWDIEIAGDSFVIEDVVQQNYSDGENEQIRMSGTIDSDVPAVLEVSLLDDSDTPDETIELWISGMSEDIDDLEVIATGLDGSVYWYYVEGVLEDDDIAFYIQVDEDVEGNVDVLESVFTMEGFLVDVVDEAQDDISIDGDDFMDDVDLDELESLVDGGPFRDGSSDDGNGDAGQPGEEDPDSNRGRDRNPSNRDDDDDDADATAEAGS